MDKKPFDAAAWRAQLKEYQHIPFMEGGRGQGTIVDDGDDKKANAADRRHRRSR
ncbi:hypothetical protein [Bradyrhizobium sp.]|uniref:hypothetical protein n=1 Tax=Bradyrhizobium sp. TaxID=376 RepID=UPI003C6FDCF0